MGAKVRFDNLLTDAAAQIDLSIAPVGPSGLMRHGLLRYGHGGNGLFL